jgi:Fe-S oxidoreductase
MDSLSDFKQTMESCNHCGQCKWLLAPKMCGWDFAEICPIHQRYHFDAYSGQGLLNIARELLDGRLRYEDGLTELIYSCTTCGACDVNCKSIRDMEVLDTILALRARCAEDGQLPEAHRATAENVAGTHNIYGLPHEKRPDWLPADIDSDDSADTAYFAGCAASYSRPDIAVNTVKILKAGGVSFQVLGPEEWCCGAPLWRTGQLGEAEKVIRHNLEAFKRRGIKTLVTSCAECTGAFKSGYPRFAETDLEVKHISEVVAGLLKEDRLKLGGLPAVTVTYHDPCMLGRQSETYVPWRGEIKAYGLHEPPKTWRRGTNGIYDEPRAVLRAIPGVELLEMTRNEENGYCCGAGGGVGRANPEFARWTAGERLREAASTGAEAVVSCCPFCAESFEDAAKTGSGQLKYFDLTELVASALQAGEGEGK